ncbi:MAG TPA: hypothetical protein VFU02_10815 [Polyangiaceae bacterium]|nr:hypothetical protein [Polyangiaceae bacterium]
MKLHSGWILLAAALPLVSLQVSCGQTSPQEISDAGRLQLRLTGQSEAGHTYRLRDAELEITGTSNVTLHSEDDPDAESLRHDLPAGAYEILLEDGWFLERQDEDGTFVPVEAVLMSANPAPFEIVAEETTNVQLRFQAGDEIVDLGDGTLEVSIVVEEEECAPGQWQQIATLPSLVQGIQRIDSDPDTLLVATQNRDTNCAGGAPAAIWRIELDHETGEATDVSFQQSLDLIQSTGRAFFESSDGTLLTGAAFCGSTPPYYSTDHGDSFQPAIEGDYPSDATVVYAELHGEVYAGTGPGWVSQSSLGSVYRYNGGGSWNHVFSFPPPHNIVKAMAVHQGRLFVGAAILDDPTDCVEDASPVYVSSDGVSFTPTQWVSCAGSVKALASSGDRLLALMDGVHQEGGVQLGWDSARERFSYLPNHPFDVRSIHQHSYVASGGAFYAAAFLEGGWDGGIYRSEDGISWTPLVEQEELILDELNIEGDTLYVADDATIYSLELCE